MGFDPIWNSFTNTGSINDYLTYKRKKEENQKKVANTSKNSMDTQNQ